MADRKLILVIDDEPDTLTFFTSLLEDNGYDTVCADNGEDGLNKLKEITPHLITLDVTMPEMSGVEYYRTLRNNEKWKNIPIIIITGVSNDFQKFISTRKNLPPPDGYLSKPVEGNELISLVKTLLKA